MWDIKTEKELIFSGFPFINFFSQPLDSYVDFFLSDRFEKNGEWLKKD